MRKTELKFNLSAADVILEISCQNLGYYRELKENYKNFLSKKTPDFKIKIITSNNLKKSPLKVKFISPHQIKINLNDLTAEVDLRLRNALVSNSENFYSFNSFLIILYSFLLLKKNSFLLHSCSVLKNNYSYVFYGQTGAGKSTLSKVLNKYKILSEEMVILKKEGRKIWTYSTPFCKNSENLKGELKGIFKIDKAKFTLKKKIDKKESFKFILSNIIYFSKNKYFLNKMFKVVQEIIEKIPSYELYFTLSSKPEEII